MQNAYSFCFCVLLFIFTQSAIHDYIRCLNEWARWQHFMIILAVNYCSESDWRILELRIRAAVRDEVHCDPTMDPVVDYPNPACFDSIIIASGGSRGRSTWCKGTPLWAGPSTKKY